MPIGSEDSGHVAIVKLDEEQLAELFDVVEDLLENGRRYILLDFTKITRLNSTGIDNLSRAKRAVRDSAGDLILFGVQSGVTKEFDASGMRFRSYPSEQEALASLG